MSVAEARHRSPSLTDANAGHYARLANSSADASRLINQASAAALLDLGLSVEQNARYLSVHASRR